VEAINQIYSAEIFSSQLEVLNKALNLYSEKYYRLLNGKNLYYMNLLNSVIKKLSGFDKSRASISNSEVLTVNELLFNSGLDNINLFKLKRYILETNLSNKVGGFAENLMKKEIVLPSSTTQSTTKPDLSNSIIAFRNFVDFLVCLTNEDCDGRIVIQRTSSVITQLKYIMLNPSAYFKSITDHARSVILLGGTLQPFSYLKNMLYPTIPQSKVKEFSCNHIVDCKNIHPLVISLSSRGLQMEFNYENRLSNDIITELHFTLFQICKIVPNGIVVFFTSYAYMDAIVSKWKSMNILAQIEKIKPLFMESKSSLQNDNTWINYSSQTSTPAGKLLLLDSFLYLF
jgi:chromosome transmission fidelity protein 1